MNWVTRSVRKPGKTRLHTTQSGLGSEERSGHKVDLSSLRAGPRIHNGSAITLKDQDRMQGSSC